MDFLEIQRHSALNSSPWKADDNVLPKAMYFNHLPTYDEFFHDIFLRNQLCILGFEATSEWTSRKLWVLPDGSPNLSYLEKHFGGAVAPVADCNAEEFCSHPKTQMTVKDYLTYWQTQKSEGHPRHSKCLYLKDWHFTRDFPCYCAYSAPVHLCSDWMNEFWDVRQDEKKADDYRFVYMGTKHSWTPFHADVLRSYSWSANICGQKKWIFYPPGEEEHFKDRHGQLVFDLQSEDFRDAQKYPQASKASERAITVIQNPGEIVFVPSGWHHQVFNMEDTISINHNWMNGCSAHLSWAFIKNQLAAVQKEIADCKEMEGWHNQCQIILKADSGMDYTDFYNFMATIATHRLQALQTYIKICTNSETGPSVKDRASGSERVCLYSNSECEQAFGNSETCVSDACVCQENQNSESNLTTRNMYCLCLYKNAVLTSTKGADFGSKHDHCSDATSRDNVKVENHDSCPHWAHCGPNLAMFDLLRVLDIVKDIVDQEEFKVVSEGEGDRGQLLLLPADLIGQIENVVQQVGLL